MSSVLRHRGSLLHTRGPATEILLSPKVLCVWERLIACQMVNGVYVGDAYKRWYQLRNIHWTRLAGIIGLHDRHRLFHHNAFTDSGLLLFCFSYLFSLVRVFFIFFYLFIY